MSDSDFNPNSDMATAANLHNPQVLLDLLQDLIETSNNGGSANNSQPASPVVTSRNITDSGIGVGGSQVVSPVNETMVNQLQALPDQSEILGRLAKIREYKRQVLDMMDKLKKNGEDIVDKETLRKLIDAYDNFKEQEEQYLGVLQKILTLKQSFTTAAMEESGFMSDAQSDSSEKFSRVSRQQEDFVNGNQRNQRPIIEDKVGFMPKASASASESVEQPTDELQALMEQREILKRMLIQQEELRALQGRHIAQVGQKESAELNNRERDYLATRQLVDDQAASLAAKRRELEELKEKLEAVKGLYADESPTVVEVGEMSVERQRDLEDKISVLKGKKRHMDEILNQLSGFHEQQQSQQMMIAEGFAALRGEQQQQPKSHEQRPLMVEEPTAAMAANQTALQAKYQELLATKKRIAEVKQMMGRLEEETLNVEASPPAPIPANQQQQRRTMPPPSMDSNNQSNFNAFSNQMRSAYESKINEQHEAVLNLQSEHERLLGIKNQLLSLNDDQLRQIAGVESRKGNEQSTVVNTNDEVWRELRARAIQREQSQTSTQGDRQHRRILNNTKDNFSDYSNASRNRSVRAANESVAATFGSFPLEEDDDVDDASIHRRNNINNNNQSAAAVNNAAATSSVVDNPRLASFRRNNDIQDVSTSPTATARRPPSVKPPPNNVVRRARNNNSESAGSNAATASMELQYDQLQQHIDSIRSIFESIMKEQRSTSSSNDAAAALQSLLAAAAGGGGGNVAAANPTLAIQQQQLTMSLLSCQQQLQMQHMEMRGLQQMCQDLLSYQIMQQQHQRVPSSDAQAVDAQARSRSASFAQTPLAAPVRQPVAAVPPLDGRPLSSSSLYNLLAPNPYLTFPYYPPQFPANVASPKNFLNNSFVGGNSTSFRAKSPYPPQQQQQQQPHSVRHHSAMDQSNFSDYGSERGNKLVENSPAKNRSGAVPKLDLDALYKSNVGKKQKNFDANVNGEAVATANATMSRVSSVASAMASNGGQDINLNADQFDALREMIYSEVATLISQNEQRPHYLLELFRELQLISSDHLRSRALHAIREVLNRFLTDDTDGNETDFEYRNAAAALANPTRTVVEETQTDNSAWTSDDEAFKEQRKLFAPMSSRDKAHDFSETACSGSTVSTPDQSSTNPFNLSQTVISFDKHQQQQQSTRSKRFENLEEINDVKNVSNIFNGKNAQVESKRETLLSAELLASKSSSVDVVALEKQIQSIVDELIPFVRENAESTCSIQLLQYLRKLTLTLTMNKCPPTPLTAAMATDVDSSYGSKRMAAALDEALAKFKDMKLADCCEEVVADISQVIFNELAIFRLLHNNIDHPIITDVRTTKVDENRITFPAQSRTKVVKINPTNAAAAVSSERTESATVKKSKNDSDSRDTTPYAELRDVEDTLDYIDDDFLPNASNDTSPRRFDVNKKSCAPPDIDKEEMSEIAHAPSSSVVHQNGPSNNKVAQLCDAE